MALTDKITAIADAIREKTNTSAPLFLDAMPSHIRSIQTVSSDTTGIPAYVATEGKRVASGMVAKRGANSLTFIAMSDMHEYGDHDLDNNTNFTTDAQRQAYLEKYRRANRNAGQGAKVVADNIDIDFFANLGDLSWGAKTSTVTDFVQSIVNARKYMYEVEKGHETFITTGNHDTGTYGFEQNGEYLSQSVMDGLIGTYRYVDFTTKKVRVICLNTAEVEGLAVSGSHGTERMTGTQLQWFADALDLSGKSDVADWGIIILSHHPLDWGAIIPAANCLQAYVTGANFSVTHNGIEVSKNFSGKNAAKVICQFHGHVHGFRVDKIRYGSSGNLKTMDIKRIAIPNACFGRNNEYGENTGVDSNGIEFGETSSYEKVDDGTANNTAFCLISIDLDNEIIYADCYGAGYDRVISYAKEVIVTYSVTNNLSNATNSNGAATIVEGSTYSASIIPNASYEVDSITVIMGGTDITATAVNGNTISIAEVTGNIVITVATTYVEDFEYGEFTNLVPTSLASDGVSVYNGTGYKNGAYVSDGVSYGTDENTVATGFINYTVGQAIYVKGAELRNTSHVRMYFKFTVGSTTMFAFTTPSIGIWENTTGVVSMTVEELGDKYYKITPNADFTGYNDRTAVGEPMGYRMSLYGTGENLIITHDEPIHKVDTVQTYSVTNNLTNVTSNNNAASADKDAAYSATLTAKSGYTMTGGTVKVTMGGVDITSTVYSNGTINIPVVTGIIVITASAVEEVVTQAYTNRVLTSIDSSGNVYNGTGYQEGYRLSSSGTTSPLDGAVNSGFIPYNGQVIRVYGTTNSNNGVTGNYVMLYDSSFTKFSGENFKNAVTNGAVWSELDGKYMITIDPSTLKTSNLKNDLSTAKYIRCSMPNCSGANFVVTLNEAIE